MIEVEVLRGVAGLEKIRQEWHSLLNQHPQPRFFHFYEWWQAYLKALESAPDSVHFILFRDQQHPVAIVPLKHRVWRMFGLPVRELGFPNHPHMPLQDALYLPGTEVASLITEWFKRSGREAGLPWDLVRCYGVMSESSLALSSTQGFDKRKGQACAYFDCTRPYEEIFHGFSKNMQANLRRARNRWTKETDGRFFIVTEPAEMQARFQDFLRLEASGWKGASGSRTAIALHSDLKLFYETLLNGFSSSGSVQLHCLELRGEVIAADFCVSDHDTLYLLKTGYNEDWSRLSPGALLCEYALQYAASEASIKHVNLIADMEWSRSWRPKIFEVQNLILFNSTPVGTLCRTGMNLKKNLARLCEKYAAPNAIKIPLGWIGIRRQ